MFFSEFVLTKKGPLAKIWLAAHLDKKLTKAQITETDIVESVESISQPVIPIALRTSGHLLLGVVKIYRRKVKYVLNECNETMTRIKLQVVPQTKVDLPEKSNLATMAQITMPERLTELDLMLPDVDLQVLTSGAQVHTTHFRDLVDDLDEWYTEETPAAGESPGPYTQTQRDQVSEGSLDQMRRTTTPHDVVDLPPIDMNLDLYGQTPSTRPGKTPPTTGEAPMMPELPELDHFEPPAEEEPGAAPPAVTTTTTTTRKRKRAVIQDEPAEISNDQFKDILKNTRDIKRRRQNAPTESVGTEPVHITSTKNIFQNPASYDFMPSGLRDFFVSGMKGAAAAGSEISSQLGEAREHEDFGVPELPPAFEDLAPVDQTPLGATTGLAPESAKSIEGVVSRMQLPHAVESTRVTELEEQLKSYLSEKGLSQQTITFVAILVEAFEKSEEVKILELIGDESSKLTAAQMFYQLLVLKTHRYVQTNQDEPFGEVTVTKTSRFDEINQSL